LSGLLKDEERRAGWRVDLKTSHLPLPQLLGALIGQTVLTGVPFISGLRRFLGADMNDRTRDYLHEMGAACATAGAVGLFHAEGITPEAIDQGWEILLPHHSTFVIDDEAIEVLEASYPVLWKHEDARPEKCYLGCPHFSLEQIAWWARNLDNAIQARRQTKVKVPTTICAAPQTLRRLRAERTDWLILDNAGVKFSAGCPMQLFDNDLAANEAIITNSNKLRTYTNARFFPDWKIVDFLSGGKL
jgi:predicted aconitase